MRSSRADARCGALFFKSHYINSSAAPITIDVAVTFRAECSVALRPDKARVASVVAAVGGGAIRAVGWWVVASVVGGLGVWVLR